MKWILRFVSLIFFVMVLAGFRNIDEISLSFAAGLWGKAIGQIIGTILFWCFLAFFFWKASNTKRHQS